MNRFLMLLVCGLVALPLAGCQNNVVYTAADPTVLTPRPANYGVEVDFSKVSRPNRVLGEVRVTRKITANFGQNGAYDLAIDEMKAQTRKVGGDAIINLKALDTQHGGTAGRLTLVGTVVAFSSPLGMGAAGR